MSCSHFDGDSVVLLGSVEGETLATSSSIAREEHPVPLLFKKRLRATLADVALSLGSLASMRNRNLRKCLSGISFDRVAKTSSSRGQFVSI